MIAAVAERPLTSSDLVTLLEGLQVERAGSRTPTEVTDAHIQILVARIGALTDALRTATFDETTRLAARMMLNDLALVAGQFRGRTNAMRASLSAALAEAQTALERLDQARSDSDKN